MYSTLCTEYDANFFYHPLHIIGALDKEKANFFWKQKSCCFAVTFIYGTNGRNSISKIESDIKQIISLPDSNYLIYRSVNLSELVIVCKNDSLTPILDSIATIGYNYPALQTHTICGFLYDTHTSLIVDDVIPEDCVSMIKVTGTIHSHEKATKIISDLSTTYQATSNAGHLAFGNNDFNLIYYNVNTKNIIKTLNNWINHSEEVLDAFTSIKTRIHIPYNSKKELLSVVQENTSLQRTIQKAKNIVSKILQKQNEYVDWICPFIETLNMLSDMCKNPVLMRIRYFVADTLYVFIKALDEIYSNSDFDELRFLQYNEKRFNSFTASFNALIECLVRVDGYLSQEPGYSPLIYNMVPAGLLEYYCSYMFTVTEAVNRFSDSAAEKEYLYATLPLPKLERYIAFCEVLPRSEHINLTTQVNLIEIPHKALYHPQELLFSITHEVMHFCGESLRCRHIRYNCFLDFLTAYLLHEFDLGSVNNLVSHYIKTCINSFISEENHLYFNKLLPEAVRAIANTYNDIELKNRLQNVLLEYKRENKEEYSQYEQIVYMNRVSCQKSLIDLLVGIKDLFKECYADLMTVLFLDLTSLDYCRIIDNLSVDGNVLKSQMEIVSTEAQLQLRKVLVVYSAGLKFPKNYSPDLRSLYNVLKSKDNGDSDWEIKLDYFWEQYCINNDIIKDYTSFAELFYNIDCIMSVVAYLKRCVKIFLHLHSLNENNNIVTDIIKFYNTGISLDGLFGNEYCDFIYKVRKKIDEKIKKY